MKARNIIPDWPRGTSTSKPYEPDTLFYATYLRRWSPRDLAMLEDEVDSDRRYHEGQARMMDDWHRSRSQSTSVLTHMLFAGELSRPDFVKEVPESQFVELVRAKSAERVKQIMESVYAGRPYYEPLEDHTWPTYGGITRYGAYTTPGLVQNWTPSDAGNITLEKIQEAFAKVKHLQPDKAFPPYYRANRITIANLQRYLPAAPEGLSIDRQFIGAKIHEDETVPLGEFWPPEGWKADV